MKNIINDKIKNDFINLIQSGTPEEITAFINRPDVGKEIVSLPLTKSNKTALHIASKYNQKLVPILLKFGADVNIRLKGGNTLLHVAASQSAGICAESIPILLKFGADPTIENANGHNALRILMDYRYRYLLEIHYRSSFFFGDNTPTPKAISEYCNLIYNCAKSLIENGASVSTRDSHRSTLLHLAADEASSFIPSLLKLGANPLIEDNSKHTPLQILLNKQPFNEEDKDYTILLAQYGMKSKKKICNTKQNILQIIYDKYPSIKNWVLSQGVPNDQLNQRGHVFKKVKVNSFALGLQIKYETVIHQARNYFLNFIIFLVTHDTIIPANIILTIVDFSFFDLKAMDKTWQECLALANAAFSQKEAIKSMAKRPGGICVLQQKNEKNNFTFHFFKSAEILAHIDFYKLQSKGIRISDQDALSCWRAHSSLYEKTPARQLALLYSIKNTALYSRKTIESKLKKEASESKLEKKLWPGRPKPPLAASKTPIGKSHKI